MHQEIYTSFIDKVRNSLHKIFTTCRGADSLRGMLAMTTREEVARIDAILMTPMSAPDLGVAVEAEKGGHTDLDHASEATVPIDVGLATQIMIEIYMSAKVIMCTTLWSPQLRQSSLSLVIISRANIVLHLIKGAIIGAPDLHKNTDLETAAEGVIMLKVLHRQDKEAIPPAASSLATSRQATRNLASGQSLRTVALWRNPTLVFLEHWRKAYPCLRCKRQQKAESLLRIRATAYN